MRCVRGLGRLDESGAWSALGSLFCRPPPSHATLVSTHCSGYFPGSGCSYMCSCKCVEVVRVVPTESLMTERRPCVSFVSTLTHSGPRRTRMRRVQAATEHYEHILDNQHLHRRWRRRLPGSWPCGLNPESAARGVIKPGTPANAFHEMTGVSVGGCPVHVLQGWVRHKARRHWRVGILLR